MLEIKKKKSCKAEKPNDALSILKSDKKSVSYHYCEKSGHYARDCYKKKNKLKKNQSHAKLANGDENSIDKPDEVALKSSTQIKDADWWIDLVLHSTWHVRRKVSTFIPLSKFH